MPSRLRLTSTILRTVGESSIIITSLLIPLPPLSLLSSCIYELCRKRDLSNLFSHFINKCLHDERCDQQGAVRHAAAHCFHSILTLRRDMARTEYAHKAIHCVQVY